MARYEAYISNNWEEAGLANVLVTRSRENGSGDYGIFLVDLHCLGVKNAWGEKDVMASSLADLLDENLPADIREPIHPACAKKLIEGAIAYAQRFGFAPHRDFRRARKVLSGLDATTCPTEFSFGKDGRPCYTRGPDDDETRVSRILSMLEARCGPDGFTYVDPDADVGTFAGDEAPDLLTLRENLLAWLDAEPPHVMRFYELSGMLTGAMLCPTPISPLKLLDEIFGPGGRTWGTLAEAEAFIGMLMRYWNHVSDLIHGCTAADHPPQAHPVDIWYEDFTEDPAAELHTAYIAWAKGLQRALLLQPEAWTGALGRKDLAPHWQMVRWWSELDQKTGRDAMTAAGQDDSFHAFTHSVAILARALRSDGA